MEEDVVIKKCLGMVGVLAMIPGYVSAEPWMVKDDPTELGLLITEGQNSECQFGVNRVRRQIEGEFYRAGIRPADKRELFLSVHYSCLSFRNVAGRLNGHAMNVNVKFSAHDSDYNFIQYVFPSFGCMVSSGTEDCGVDFFVNCIVRKFNEALTEFMHANHWFQSLGKYANLE